MNSATPTQVRALSVSAAMQLAKGALEGINVTIVGEVSGLSNKPGYKAVYFTIKDKSAALDCLMWKNRYSKAGVQLENGQAVEISGRFTVYAVKGRMNFDVTSIKLAGEGNLRLQVANLAKKLNAEGLMDASRKKPLPEMPMKIGVVTSPRGDAVHDVLRTLRRRFPVARVLFAGVAVEGANAPAGIISAISAVVSAGAEVVLVVRGGGSYEDLMPFNDEMLARKISACPVPVVTGIGHEPDTSIADMVASFRASTPTAAAEAVSPARESLEAELSSQVLRMRSALDVQLQQCRTRVERAAQSHIFSNPDVLLSAPAQEIDTATEQLLRQLKQFASSNATNLNQLKNRLLTASKSIGASCRVNCEASAKRLHAFAPHVASAQKAALSALVGKLDALSPLGTIARGYSIAKTPAGGIVKSISGVSVGSKLDVTVADGVINCNVAGTEKIETDVIKFK